MAQPETTPIRRKLACDACRARKVKCNGEERCQQCSHLGLHCLYSVSQRPKKRVHRGSILKPWQTAQSIDYRSIAPVAGSKASPDAICTLQSTSPSGSLSMTYDPGFFFDFLSDYEQSVYPFHPIISPPEAKEAMLDAVSNLEARAFVYALAAVIVGLTHCGVELGDDAAVQSEHYIRQAMKLQKPVLSIEDVTVRRIITMELMHSCLHGLRNVDLGFYCIRQSMTMAQMMRFDDEATMSRLTSPDRARRQRLYWLLFIHERFMALFGQRMMILPPLYCLPDEDHTIPPSVDHGFRQIIRLFSNIDHDFITKWTASGVERETITPEWIEAKHRAIDGEGADVSFGTTSLSPMQVADLTITKHWLHMLLWQMAVSQCLLSSTATEHSLSLLFPIRVSTQLRNVISDMPWEVISFNGSGMQQKLFEITDTIASVITTVPAVSEQETRERIDDFRFLLSVFLSLPHATATQRDVLEHKLGLLTERHPQEFAEYSSQLTPQS